MQLLLDIGNTRIKWAMLTERGLQPQQAEAFADWQTADIVERVLAPLGHVEAVWVSNVAGERMAKLVSEATQSVWELTPTFVESTAQYGAVRSAYLEPKQLGVDRWLTLIGAHALAPRSACIVGVGTAMTLDGIDAGGRHLGGLIVPGPELMVSSLMRNTSDIADRAAVGDVGEGLFATSTRGGVYQGAVHALAGLIEHALGTMKLQLGETPLLLLHGGAADRVQPQLRTPVRLEPDLVLQGLAVMARQSAGAAARV